MTEEGDALARHDLLLVGFLGTGLLLDLFGTALLGWFELETKNPQLLACMQRLHGKRKLLQLIKLGEKSEVTPTVRNAVQQRSAAGVWESTGAELKRIPKEEVAQVSRGPIDGLVINDRPISVAG